MRASSSPVSRIADPFAALRKGENGTPCLYGRAPPFGARPPVTHSAYRPIGRRPITPPPSKTPFEASMNEGYPCSIRWYVDARFGRFAQGILFAISEFF